MSTFELINKLEIEQERIYANQPSKLRPFFDDIDITQRGMILTGTRGVGKTTFLISKIKEHNMFFVFCDNPLVSNVGMWDIANQAFMAGYDGIIFDEVHSGANWSQHLKALYDAFPNKKIWASDSCSIELQTGFYDLSRRFVSRHMPLLSFREYLFFKNNVTLPKVDPFSLSSNECQKILDSAPVLKAFRSYLEEGQRPFFIEGDYSEKIRRVITKTLFSDLPLIVSGLTDDNIRLMNAIVGYVAQSKIPTINIESLCSEWAIGKQKLYKLLSALESVGVFNIVRKQNDHSANSKGAKIFFHDVSTYYAIGLNVGNVREAFVVSSFKNIQKTVLASSNEVNADLIINGKLVEVGGKSKKIKKADFVIKDDIDIVAKNQIPLWTLGLML